MHGHGQTPRTLSSRNVVEEVGTTLEVKLAETRESRALKRTLQVFHHILIPKHEG